MNTQLLSQSDPSALLKASKIVKAGGVVAIPTDTVYGIGVMAYSANAINRLYQIKGRSFDKPIPIMIGSMDQLELVVESIPEVARRLAVHFWPGPLTLVLSKRSDLPDELSSLPTVGVRVPDHKFAQALLDLCGPMAVTSANRSGEPEGKNANEVIAQLGGILELVVDGGQSPGGAASTVVDFSSRNLQILRKGPITRAMIEEVLKDEAVQL